VSFAWAGRPVVAEADRSATVADTVADIGAAIAGKGSVAAGADTAAAEVNTEAPASALAGMIALAIACLVPYPS